LHGPHSREYYRDFQRTERLAGLPALYRVEDDNIYGLPPQPLAHLLKPEEVAGADLPRYVAAIGDPSRPPLRALWSGASRLALDGPVWPGELISVQVNADLGWRALQDGRAIAITRDGLGFMILHPAPAAAVHIELRYGGTAEQRIMAAVSAAAWAGALWPLFRARKRQSRA
jgi:hypothetical protein